MHLELVEPEGGVDADPGGAHSFEPDSSVPALDEPLPHESHPASPPRTDELAVDSSEKGLYVAQSSGFEGLKFEDFFRGNYAQLMRHALLMGATRFEAEDAVQTCFIEMYQTWDDVRNPAAYARRGVGMALHKQWRKEAGRGNTERRQLSSVDPLAASPPENPTVDSILKREQLEEAVEMLGCLAPRERSCLALSLDGFSSPEIAEMLDVSPNLVRQMLWRARRRVRPLLARK
ncbi:RNA polymerase sigma factor [Streptomyces luteogriseus]|uniref:RNA polymerase sigma factor n=1 Tax=Streptomyces luteogriseus TaxID=68233 RepID=UPI0037FFA038